jgi:hypothetical protein
MLETVSDLNELGCAQKYPECCVYIKQRVSLVQSSAMLNPFAAAALQAAQWSLSNGYAGQVSCSPVYFRALAS